MPKIHKIAIVGHVNSGKSSLFNAIIKKNKAIVDDIPGLTIDRNTEKIKINNLRLSIIDTGGIILEPDNIIEKNTLLQVHKAIEEAEIIIFLTEYPEIHDIDKDIAEILRKSNKKVILTVNKIDNKERELEIFDFYSLGFKNIIPISVVHNKNIDLLLKAIVSLIENKTIVIEQINDKTIEDHKNKKRIQDRDQDSILIAVIGKPNSGKSTLLNKIIGSDRCIVSEIPGTTRDAVDIEVKRNGHSYIFIDTAGMRKRSKIKSSIEYYSVNRTIRALKRSDIVLHLIDANEGLTETDKKIFAEITKNYKPAILILNKWDLIPNKEISFKKLTEEIRFRFPHISHVPIKTISAKKGTRTEKIFKWINELQQMALLTIDTPSLNRFFNSIMNKYKGKTTKGQLKIYYAVQKQGNIPIFILFINKKELFTDNINRYIQNKLRNTYKLSGIPIKLILKEKKVTA